MDSEFNIHTKGTVTIVTGPETNEEVRAWKVLEGKTAVRRAQTGRTNVYTPPTSPPVILGLK